jgi:multidrug resistance efflux pump
MSTQAPPTAVPVEAFESLATLQQLTLEAGLSEDLKQLQFRMLNRSVAYCRYDRATLWDLRGRQPRLLGVSGQADGQAHGPLVDEWQRVVAALPRRETVQLGPQVPDGVAGAWQCLMRRTGGLAALWLPIVVDNRPVAALWLERWAGGRFTESDRKCLDALALAYAVAWRSVAPRPAWWRRALATRPRMVTAGVLITLLGTLVFVSVPLRIVAQCEVVPKDPVAITAPLAGVIAEVVVLPGRTVESGTLLAVYDKRVAEEELKVAQQQVQIVESDLQRARVQAFQDAPARAPVALLENRLAQERTRLGLAQHHVDQLEIRAPVSGTVMLTDPHEWRGRPVQVGERLMMVVDPQQTRLRIWLPEKDNLRFNEQRPLHVILDADPRTSHPATLRFLANHSQTTSTGQVCFRAEAEWATSAPNVKTGLQGTAVRYGDTVPLGYWLLRRPLAAVRRWSGV